MNAAGREDWTAFHVAVYMGRLEAAKLLLERGADANAVFCDEGHTALHAACYLDKIKMVQLLVSLASISINAVDVNGRSAIDYCAYYGRISCLEALLAAGAEPCSSDCKSLSYAVCRGHEACARLLMDRGGYLLERVFYEQILVEEAALPLNRRAVLIAAQNDFPECLMALLKSMKAVDVEESSWRGISRTKA